MEPQAETPQVEITEESKKRKRQPADPHDRRTVMVVNLPKDVTLRELQNMLNFWPGFLKVQLYDNTKRSKRQEGKDFDTLSSFILFDSQTNALIAKDKLNGYTFDHAKGAILHATLAQKNLVLSRQDAEDLQRRPEFPGAPTSVNPYSDVNLLQSVWDPTRLGTDLYSKVPGATFNPYSVLLTPTPPPRPRRSGKKDPPRTYPPINTLFITGLDSSSDTDIVGWVRQNTSGFKDYKFVVDNRGARVGWLEFESIPHAEQAIPILSSRFQAAFSKNPLNKRTNTSGPSPVQPTPE